MTFNTAITLGTLIDSNRKTSGDPEQIEVGDFNGDGKIDFVISRNIGEGYIPTDMRFMLNVGNGKWEDKTDALFPGGAPKTQYGKPIVADFNNDGKSDIYVAAYGVHSPDGTGGYDQVWLATDSGQMKVASVSNIAKRTHGVSIGDINQDGYLDVVLDTVDSKITNPTADLIMINDGKGNFFDNQNSLPASQRTGSLDRLSHTASLLIDLTGDGAPELVLGTWEGGVQKVGAKPNYSPPSEIFINDGHGNYANSGAFLLPQSTINPESVMDIDSIDVNNDGLNDLILDITRGGDGSTGQYYGTGYLQILINKGNGQFVDETASRYPEQVANTPSSWWKFVRKADFNQDGFQDLLLTGAGGGAAQYNQSARVLLNDGAGHFITAFTLAVIPSNSNSIVGLPDVTSVADVNGDNYPDLVTLQSNGISDPCVLVGIINDMTPTFVVGTSGSDNFVGGFGNDTFTLAGGADIIDGGIGKDTVVLDGKRGDYKFEVDATTKELLVTSSVDGLKKISNVELFSFSDFKNIKYAALLPSTAKIAPPSNATSIGSAENDILTGYNAVFWGGPGNDTITGLSGINTSIHSGALREYTVTNNAGVFTVVDSSSGRDGTDTLKNIQNIQFTDYSINTTMKTEVAKLSTTTVNSLIELYVAYFARTPDATGLAYWIDKAAAGESLTAISKEFYNAGVQFSSLTGYSATMANSDFIKIVYTNVLGRSGATAPPASDVAYWDNQIKIGATTKEGLIQTMLTAAHTFTNDPTWGWVPQLLNNKVTVGYQAAVTYGLDYNAATDAITQGMAIAHAVTATDTTAAVGLIGVGGNIHL